MYVKTTTRQNENGTVCYLHLANNEWDPDKGRAAPKLNSTICSVLAVLCSRVRHVWSPNGAGQGPV
jgi:hypothetical protein